MAELEGQPTAPASETPATPAFDPEAFKAQLLAEWEAKTNERISGVQSSFQKALNEKDAEIRELKTASLSEDEREQLADQEAQQEIEELRYKAWLYEDAAKRFPNAVPHIQKLFETKGDLPAFAEYLESALHPTPATPEPEPAETVPDVDPNNAPRSAVAAGADSFVGEDGQVYTPELRQQILASLGNRSLAEIREG